MLKSQLIDDQMDSIFVKGKNSILHAGFILVKLQVWYWNTPHILMMLTLFLQGHSQLKSSKVNNSYQVLID